MMPFVCLGTILPSTPTRVILIMMLILGVTNDRDKEGREVEKIVRHMHLYLYGVR